MNITDVKSQLPSPDIIDDLSELFKILGDQTRSKILFVLEQGEFCVSDISEAVGMTKYAVSHQLRTLKFILRIIFSRIGCIIFMNFCLYLSN